MAASPWAVCMDQYTQTVAAPGGPFGTNSGLSPLLKRDSYYRSGGFQRRHPSSSSSTGGHDGNAGGVQILSSRSRRVISVGVADSNSALLFSPGPSGRRKNSIRPSAEKKQTGGGGISFGDRLLDYIEGGPKLRKWYGAPDQLPKDGGSKKSVQKPEEPVEEEEEEDLVRDKVLVTDADSDIGQLVVLELILKRSKVRALVKDIKAATEGFGPYVEPVGGDVNDREVLKRVVRGVRAIICPKKVGRLADRDLVRGVEHIVLLSKLTGNRNQGGLGSLFGGLSRVGVEENEAAVSELGVPYTIIRAGNLKDEEGGQLGFRYGQDGSVEGSISREDAAYVCVEALDSPPKRALVFEVVNGEEEVESWSAVLTSLQETSRSN